MTTKMLQVRWATGSKISIDPEKAHDEMEAVRFHNGGTITVDDVLDKARDRRSVMHPFVFDCDDQEAAGRYRRERARSLLNSLVVVRDDMPETPVRKYLTVDPDNRGKGIFHSTEEAMAVPTYRVGLLARAKAELNSFRRKYAHLEQLRNLIREIDRLIGED